jgi:hypothetical protein
MPNEPGAGSREQVDGARVGGLVDEEGIARIEERAGDQVEGLLAARRDQDVLGRGGDSLAGEVFGDQGAEPGDAVPRGVLEGLGALRAEHVVEATLEQLVGDEIGGGLHARASDRRLPPLRPAHAIHPAQRLDGGRPREEGIPGKPRPIRRLSPDRRRDRVRDERAPTDGRHDEARGFEIGVGPHHGVAVDTELLGEVTARREAEARGEDPRSDPPDDLVEDLAMEWIVGAGVEGEAERAVRRCLHDGTGFTPFLTANKVQFADIRSSK